MKNVNGLYSFVKGPKWLDYLINVILNPSIWNILTEGYKSADELLDELIIKFQTNEYTISIDSYAIEFLDKEQKSIARIWISNFPFSYGYAYKFTKSPMGIKKYQNPTRYGRILFRRFEESIKVDHHKANDTMAVDVLLKQIRS